MIIKAKRRGFVPLAGTFFGHHQPLERSSAHGAQLHLHGYLTHVSPEWADKVGPGKEVQWPVGVHGQGNDGLAAVGVEFPEYLPFSVSNSAGAQAYPVGGGTWILAFGNMEDPTKVEVLKAWPIWSLNEGTPIGEELGYARLPE